MAEVGPVASLVEEIIGNIKHRSLEDLTRKHLHKCLEASQTPFSVKNDQASRWLSWARHREHVKVVSADVPDHVLPDGIKGILHDVKVFTKRGPDDEIYDKNKDIRDKVARGNCFLEITNGENAGNMCIIYALKKFTGGLGDDDDRDTGDDSTWKRYFTKSLDDTVSVIATRKANGEAAHLSARKISGEFVICCGSKNVHLLVRCKKDLEHYVDDRYRVARQVCETVMDHLESMEEVNRLRLLEFLSATGLTATMEILNPTHQHVEDLSYLKSCLLQFICWTSSDLEPPDEGQICCMPPHVAIEIAQSLGLPSVSYDIIPMADLDSRMLEVRQGYGYEGEVFYFLDGSDSVIGLLKKKTAWYILCRAIREKARGTCQQHSRNPSTFSVTKSVNKVEERINQIQTWLGLDPHSTEEWKNLGTHFVRWCLHEIEVGNITTADVADMFPVTWKRYLEDTKQTDRVQHTWTKPQWSSD